ncbi:hypothetical protein O3M35_002489 [Rhynocoris fuscipes]|uniref:THAP-type domain-containing protein n=1 Tax=Rhynocoris fuscipes TaxID=488301 RepID=A0AAW1CLZ0_9HEMI
MDEDNTTYFKYCLVPFCKNTTIKTPNKIFFRLPVDRNRRAKWLKACRRNVDGISPKSGAIYVCEDHFNLEEDMENYMRFKLMGGLKKIKAAVVPHIFDCQPDRKRASTKPTRTAAVKRERKRLIQEAMDASVSIKTLEDQKILSVESNLTQGKGPKGENEENDEPQRNSKLILFTKGQEDSTAEYEDMRISGHLSPNVQNNDYLTADVSIKLEPTLNSIKTESLSNSSASELLPNAQDEDYSIIDVPIKLENPINSIKTESLLDSSASELLPNAQDEDYSIADVSIKLENPFNPIKTESLLDSSASELLPNVQDEVYSMTDVSIKLENPLNSIRTESISVSSTSSWNNNNNRNERSDEFSLLGEEVAIKVRKLPTKYARCLVQYKIQRLLFKASLGKYDYPKNSSEGSAETKTTATQTIILENSQSSSSFSSPKNTCN